MSKNIWIGAALGLALCPTVLTSCSVKENRSDQSQHANLPAIDWTNKAEDQLRKAIAHAQTTGRFISISPLKARFLNSNQGWNTL